MKNKFSPRRNKIMKIKKSNEKKEEEKKEEGRGEKGEDDNNM